MEKYDAAIVGCWDVKNYGSQLTYYALYCRLKEMGYSLALIGSPKSADYKSQGTPNLFQKVPYPQEDLYQYDSNLDLWSANELSDVFIVGSDQLWNIELYHYFGEYALLDFLLCNKKRIAYATSFGKNTWEGTYPEKVLFSYYLKKFDYISVREKSGINICRDKFSVSAEWTLDPIFLTDRRMYEELAEKAVRKHTGKYIFAYILDTSVDKENLLKHLSNKMGCELVIVTDPNYPRLHEWKLNPHIDYKIEDWLNAIANSEWVITDSFHGMCVSMALQKNFTAIVNKQRGAARFWDYGELLGVLDHMVEDVRDVITHEEALIPVNYQEVDEKLNVERNKSYRWLNEAIKSRKEKTNYISAEDISNIRLEMKLDKMNLLYREKRKSTSLLSKTLQRIKEEGLARTIKKISVRVQKRE